MTTVRDVATSCRTSLGRRGTCVYSRAAAESLAKIANVAGMGDSPKLGVPAGR